MRRCPSCGAIVDCNEDAWEHVLIHHWQSFWKGVEDRAGRLGIEVTGETFSIDFHKWMPVQGTRSMDEIFSFFFPIPYLFPMFIAMDFSLRRTYAELSKYPTRKKFTELYYQALVVGPVVLHETDPYFCM